MELINHKNAETYAITQRTSSKVTWILVLYDFSAAADHCSFSNAEKNHRTWNLSRTSETNLTAVSNAGNKTQSQ
jgi:hypothetical protein